MSILAGPFERNVVQTKTKDDEEEDLLVFGYACKLYRDDAKALMEESGQLLIPWMGDHSLMVDRYDVRNRLEDKNKFGLKSNLPHRPTVEEVELEEELDRERYLALENDDIRVAEQEEEEKKRKQESSFSAVGFSYANMAPSSVSREEDEDPPLLACYPQQLEHPPTSSVDQGGDGEEEYVPPPGLIIPANIKPPATMKLHSIIEKTALFIVKQGAQMEIIIKAKQKYNPFFSFLNHDDELFPYYQHIKAMLTRGAYVPRQVSPAPPPPKHERDSPERTNGIVRVAKGGVEERGDRGANGVVRDDRTSGEPQTESDKSVESGNDKDEEESSGDESDSDDEGGYLHPLLMGGALKNLSKSSTPTPGTREASPSIQKTTNDIAPSTTATCTTLSNTTTNTEAYTTSSIAFYSKRLFVNSAPLIDTRTTPSESPRVATSSSAVNRNGNGTDQHPLQYSYGSGTDQHMNPQLSSEAANSGAYSDQYAHGYGHQTHGEYSDAYSSHHNHQYAQDGGGYYDGGTATVDGTAQYDYQAYYYHQSAADGAVQYDGSAYSSATPTTAPPPAPAPEDLPVVTKTAEYVAKNGDAFERTVIERHAGDPRFGFLNPWDKGHAYYQMLKQQHRQRLAYEAYSSQMGWNQYPGMGMGPGPGAQPPPLSYETNKENIVSEPTNLQRLSETGAVSFKLQPKSAKSAFDPSSLVDLGTAEDTGEGDEGQWSTEEDGPPPAKKPRAEWNSNNKMGTKVEEFLSTVKALIGTE